MMILNDLRRWVSGPDALPPAAPKRFRPGTRAAPVRLSLALQGGGSFGAFTWGVLDRLLDEEGIHFDTVSGSSAGAINATLLASGLAHGGRHGAQAQLERFWRRASGAAPAPHLNLALSAAARLFSPYQFNPLDLNPLRTLLETHIDFEHLRARCPTRLLIGATRVADGRLHIFREGEISADVLLASACLPLLNQAVEIEGEAYWDGGYAANPPLLPLVSASGTPDILVVQIVPMHQTALPRSPADIKRRLEHMTFNASLVRDFDTLETMRKLAGTPVTGTAGDFRLHHIAAEDFRPTLNDETALRLDWSFLSDLRAAGRDAAERWLLGHDDQTAVEAPSPAAHSASSPARKVG